MVEGHSIGFVAPLITRPYAIGRGPRLLHTAFTHSFIVPFSWVPVAGDTPGDGDEHPTNTATAKMAAKQSTRLLDLGIMSADSTAAASEERLGIN
jgi:hypothetical protein